MECDSDRRVSAKEDARTSWTVMEEAPPRHDVKEGWRWTRWWRWCRARALSTTKGGPCPRENDACARSATCDSAVDNDGDAAQPPMTTHHRCCTIPAHNASTDRSSRTERLYSSFADAVPCISCNSRRKRGSQNADTDHCLKNSSRSSRARTPSPFTMSTCDVPKKPFFCWPARAGWLLLIVAMLVMYTPVSSQKLRPGTDLSSHKEKGVCQSVDIRNSPETFERLRGCRVVEGFVQILLFDSPEESMYNNISFPELTEITGYLLLYRVNGLRSLSKLFPNLTVIRGQSLFFNYAFVLFEMSSLQEIGLYSLTDITNGLVRIDKNPSLCFVNTIDWDIIAHDDKGDHFIKSNKLENECPICPGDDGNDQGMHCPLARHKDTLTHGPKPGRHLCWNRLHCQKVCPEKCGRNSCVDDECCHESCLGTCSKDKKDECAVCRHLSIGTGRDKKCLRNCPADTYEFMHRRCIVKNECYNQKRPIEFEYELSERPYKPFNGSCLLHCPTNYVEGISEDGNQICEPCKDLCRKDCNAASVDSVSSARQLRGCTHIKGPLEIHIRGGRNIVKELEENLNMIEEIEGYLKIVRSFPLVSLNFLKNLRIIHGDSLENGKYVFVVLDNQNLQELWDWDTQTNHSLQIKKGRLFFHFNPKLCLYKIERLKQVANLSEFTDLEVAPNSNGDKVACNVTELKVNVTSIKSTVVILSWDQFRMDDPRSLLGYVVYSTEAPHQNITLYDGRDACRGDKWRVDDVNNPDETSIGVFHILTHLKPYTQYAFYVKTYTIATERSGAQSSISYFRTKPYVPSPPVNLNVRLPSSDKLLIQWQPPLSPNGNVTHYKISWTWEEDDQKILQQRNYCNEPPSSEDNKPVVYKIEETTTKESNESCSCEASDVKSTHPDKIENERLSQINFEDALHNAVYIKREPRRKREIDIKRAIKRYTTDKNVHFPNNFNEKSTTPFDENRNVTNGTVRHTVYGNTTFTMKGLRHFAQYSIEVQACREREDVNDTESNCSTKSIVTARTLKKEGEDDIKDITVQVFNQSLGRVRLTWEEPVQPNGIILTYVIEYRRIGNENLKPTYECVTRQKYLDKKEYILKDLSAGNYSVRVMATSLAGNGVYSHYKYFFIKEPNAEFTGEILISIFVAILLLCVSGVIYFFIRRKFGPNVPNMKLIASVNPEYVSTVYVPDDWEVPRKKIELLGELGQGSFGMVYEGIARDVVKGKSEIRCAIKTVNEHATDRERIEFLNEASVMKAFDTSHVVRLLGVVSQGQPTLVVMELMANGDLKSYLRSHRPDVETYNPSSRQPPTLKRILQMAIEIADGMAYLAAKKFVHRDLAARNCMVAEDLTVKIGDFGMTRDIYETDYYRKGTKGLLPVRWMAPESLKDGVFTSNSDVWSYGVVLWEMATLASQPYQGLSNDQVLRYVIDGGIMERPENCPDKLYNLMRVCWQHKPTLRPSFLDLATMLLEDGSEEFRRISFYHSNAGVEARTIHPPAQDDPSTPLRLTKELEDFSLGSGSEQESEPECLVDDNIDSDADQEHVSINFPRFQTASFKDNHKNVNTSGPSLYSLKDNSNSRSQDTYDPSLCSYNEQTKSTESMGPRSLYNTHEYRRSSVSLQSARGSLLKDSDATLESGVSSTANGYLGGRPSNGATTKTSQC